MTFQKISEENKYDTLPRLVTENIFLKQIS